MKKQRPTFKCLPTSFADSPYRTKEKNALFWCMLVTGLAMLVEFFGGLWTNSLALLSDAAHMFSHLFSLGVSFAAIVLASREVDEARSYGFHRAEILAALFNGITLFLIVLWIGYDAIHRFLNPVPIATSAMLWIAVFGLLVNLGTMVILKSVRAKDLNVRSAFFHMLSDTLSSVGIIIAGVLIYYTGKTWLDPFASLLIAVMILLWSFQLIRESVHILLESKPKHLSPKEIAAALRKEIPGIHGVHHIHIWELTSELYAFTAHIEIENIRISESEQLHKQINQLLCERYHITHTNLQFECKR
ncbi:MAG: cation transporter [Deltaproteobacteria bacterium]|nr:cation transporter [Deltaproteobacteria bacterium]